MTTSTYDRRRSDIVTSQQVGRHSSCGTRPQLGQKAVVAEHADESTVDRADHEHQPAMTRGGTVAGVEIGRHLYGPHSVMVKVSGFDVRDPFRVSEGERDDVCECRLTSVKRAKRVFDRRAGHLSIDEGANLGLVEDQHACSPCSGPGPANTGPPMSEPTSAYEISSRIMRPRRAPRIR